MAENKQTSVYKQAVRPDRKAGGQWRHAMIYATRYQARKHVTGSQVTVKVDGGYANMDARQYNVWRRQK